MYPIYYGLAIIASLAALIGTIVIAKNVNKPENTSSPEDDAKQLKNAGSDTGSIPLLTTIYAITFVITAILMWIFIF
ncbi:hypothetical protein [Halobacillus faecis]|uniref:Uncharacterized protein n=1 Tax=Halobacillus faecis TaxID=360184 RepID=A0A511WR17_9BACI|nr:hypothetical protein [Halobacillus faecis]GEN53594.1 hypothetical protein HFA01_18560 [Halobacillus faecis]